ncbi:hypothetical protein GCM10007920_27530 [Ciceribacter naphthalenivorans]|uniref:PAS domain-containing protein n=3 Tax=Pseudomonadota TaxID=1224 RepID=A0A512HHV8_9HYPH|nr:hypothetical protein RNA01_19630 [Ciceribacter naphthalenivorans]GLR22965.1 hypothetical protein GCM10007920_27530 [Ciceribacter naphthalenivorans]GLT05821.1 hypothetical protein GCM10007926_27530 [Sphingomonas psychrolutea]
MQLRFIGSLIREDADDRSCVQRHAAVLSLLLDRYFGDTRQHSDCPPIELAGLEVRGGGEVQNLNESILDGMPDCIAVVTLDSRFLYANAAHARLLEATQLEIVGLNLFDFVDDAQSAEAISHQLDRCFAGEPSEGFCCWRVSGKGLSLRNRVVPLRSSRGEVMGAIITLVNESNSTVSIAA